MCKHIKCIHIIFIAILLSVMVHGKNKNKKRNKDFQNDVLEKSEVTLKIPTYYLKIPVLTSKHARSKVNPIPVSCNSKNVTSSLSNLRKKIKCIPRDTVVEISAPDGYKVVPNTVVVKRCGGMCSGGKKCLPVKRKNAEFYVRSTKDKSTMVYCSNVRVPEDIECKCDCEVKQKCSTNQRFDSTLCKCICTNREDHQECLSRPETQWSSTTCSCGCKYEKRCTTGSQWEQSKCRCVKQYDD